MHRRRNEQNQLENQATDFQRKAGAAKERNDPLHWESPAILLDSDVLDHNLRPTWP